MSLKCHLSFADSKDGKYTIEYEIVDGANDRYTTEPFSVLVGTGEFSEEKGNEIIKDVKSVVEVEKEIVNAGKMEIGGYFVRYDFDKDGKADSYNDWAYVVNSTKKVYQLLANAPTQNNIFGWKAVDVTIDDLSNGWIMSHYGDGSLDWVLFSSDCTKVYKLAGSTDMGTFSYDVDNDGVVDRLNLECFMNGSKVLFFEK